MATNINEEVAGLVARAMTEKGISRMKLSDETGIPNTTLKRKINAQTPFDFEDLYLISTALNKTPSYFTPRAFVAEAVA